MLKKLLIIGILVFSNVYASSINIAVAANVSYAIDDLKKEFNKLYPDTKVRVTLGSSGKLTAQILNGAPYSLFMSANMKYPNKLYEKNIATTKPIVYAKGSLAILSNKQRIFRKGINLLKSKLVKRIAVANPKTAPYGVATFEALKNANILNDIKKKIIYGESISQTVSYTMIAADVGVIAKSSLYSPKMRRFKKGINWADVNPTLYTPINQGMVLLKNGKKNSDAVAFYDFIKSKKAKKIFIDFGYLVP